MNLDKKKSLLLLGAVALGTVAYNALKPVVSRPDVVEPFNLDKYLGKWYEIARLDFRWERGLSQVTAEYSKNKDGSIRVNNQGYSEEKERWKQSLGKAKFVNGPQKGALKVSFFGPFYSGYNIVRITPDYKYALIFGDNLDYMWILGRDTEIPDKIKNEFLTYALQCGYETGKLVWTKQ